MTVGELMEILSKHDPKKKVMLSYITHIGADKYDFEKDLVVENLESYLINSYNGYITFGAYE
jgi:hypothetical protein